MGLSRYLRDLTIEYNTQYKITIDTSGYDKTTIHTIGAMTGTMFVYGSNDAGQLHSVTDGNATLATNFSTVQATNLATGSAVTSISAAGLFTVTDNAQFLRLQGNPAATPTNVYRLLILQSKSS